MNNHVNKSFRDCRLQDKGLIEEDNKKTENNMQAPKKIPTSGKLTTLLSGKQPD